MKKIKALVITGFGLNCETETSAAFSMCGAEPLQIHLNELTRDKNTFDQCHILVFIGGFSFGDHLGAGTVFANRIKYRFRGSCHSRCSPIDSAFIALPVFKARKP